MQEEHRKAIQNVFGSLVEQTDLDSMVTALYEKGVFSEQMIEPYKNKNKDVRQRKRELYNDITRRGPNAFKHLLDSLSEQGYWNLVRDLDPDSPYHPRTHFKPKPLTLESSGSSEGFLSISESKIRHRKKPPIAAAPPRKPINDEAVPVPEDVNTPDLEVVKATKFFDDNGQDIKLYRTRGRRRGYLLMLSYVAFAQDSETHRKGVEVDCRKLKHLFEQIGFTVESHMNLTMKETTQTLENLKLKLVEDWESLFIVVSSHGYKKHVEGETDIRCSDLNLISDAKIINHFNNKNFPKLNGIPKVFIFQVCRGTIEDFSLTYPKDSTSKQRLSVEDTPTLKYSYDSVTRDGQPSSGGVPLMRDRLYSDILIAHSTLPGFVSYRDEEAGSWYIQTVCEVFAARAHDCDVFTLFTLVDKRLDAKYHIQTSTIETRGFNKRLYLHPGLFEDEA